MPWAAGQESCAGTEIPLGPAMQLSQGHDRPSLSPAGLTRWYRLCAARVFPGDCYERAPWYAARSEEHTSELQSLRHLVCRLLLEKKKQKKPRTHQLITRPTEEI